MTTTEGRTFEEITADWPTYYGIKLADVGEDGDVIVLGHHEDRKRVIAALNRHARTHWGEASLVSPFGGTLGDVPDDLMQRWARFLFDCEEPEGHASRLKHEGRCWRCADITSSGGWAITWAVKSTDPGAFPITHWMA